MAQDEPTTTEHLDEAPRIVVSPRQIASGVRLPPMRRPGRPRSFLIREMKPGDSFFIPEEPGRGRKPLLGAKSAVRYQTRGLPGPPRKFEFRRVSHGWRCWRTE